MKRRRFLASSLLLLAARPARAVDFAPVVPGRTLSFPRDYGSHPLFRTEWWYLTGLTRDASGNELGVQVTFFRTRPGLAEGGSSAFAPRQLLFAHAALAEPRRGRLRHDQKAARAGFGLAEAAEETTNVHIGEWSLQRVQGAYTARVVARDFSLDLRFAPTQSELLEGDRGYSRKGPEPSQASYYYSEPQLAVAGSITVDGNAVAVTGTAWLDHEWSSEYLPAGAAGWDWTGINFADGGALMAFAMRGRSGEAIWAGGTLRAGDGRARTFTAEEIAFVAQRRWRSPRTQAEYPVAMMLRAGSDSYALEPMFDDQELDARGSTGTLYWEGAVRALREGRELGRGYLELTGYGQPVKL